MCVYTGGKHECCALPSHVLLVDITGSGMHSNNGWLQFVAGFSATACVTHASCIIVHSAQAIAVVDHKCQTVAAFWLYPGKSLIRLQITPRKKNDIKLVLLLEYYLELKCDILYQEGALRCSRFNRILWTLLDRRAATQMDHFQCST